MNKEALLEEINGLLTEESYGVIYLGLIDLRNKIISGGFDD